MTTFEVLGDPHLGRSFRTGVPLHRRGHREEMVWKDFETSLMTVKADLHVNMGDLFDRFVVAPEVVLRAFRIYEEAALRHPTTTFVVLEGNHDTSRDIGRASSFDLFAELVASVPNIRTVRKEPYVEGRFGFVPFNAFKPTALLVESLPDDLKVVFGHWDVVDFGGENVIPTNLLARKGILRAVTGHDHIPRIVNRDGVEVRVVGSMQPYSHAEDLGGRLYVTVGLEDLEGLETRDLNIRVRLKEGEVLPEGIDCLSLTAIREDRKGQDDIEAAVDVSEFEALDLRTLLGKTLEDLSVRDEIMGMLGA